MYEYQGCDNDEIRLEGAFVETAFTAEEVENAITEENRRGIQDARCAFLGDRAIESGDGGWGDDGRSVRMDADNEQFHAGDAIRTANRTIFDAVAAISGPITEPSAQSDKFGGCRHDAIDKRDRRDHGRGGVDRWDDVTN